MQKFVLLIERFSRMMTGIAFCVLMVAVIIQVFGRANLFDAPIWTEELTRYALLFVGAFGVGLSYHNGELINVDMVSESLPNKWPKVFRFISALATAFLCAMLIGPAWLYTSIGAYQTSPALQWRMDFIHVSILVMLISLLVFSAVRTLSMLMKISDGLPEVKEEDTQ